MPRADHLAAARALTLLRVALGGVLLVAASGKFTMYPLFGWLHVPMASAAWQVDLPARLASWLVQHPDGVAAAVVRDLLLPHGPLVAGLVAWVQALAGVSLVLGWHVRVAAAGAFLVATLLALVAAAGGGVDARPHLLLMLLSAAIAIGRAGEWGGLDGWRLERRRRMEF